MLTESTPRKQRMHALWALAGSGQVLDGDLVELFKHPDAGVRAWAVRAAGNQAAGGKADRQVAEGVARLAREDASRDVMLQCVIAGHKIKDADATSIDLDVLARCGNDKLIPHIVWQNLHPALEKQADEFLSRIEKDDKLLSDNLKAMMPRILERVLARKGGDAKPIVRLLALVSDGKGADPAAAKKCFEALTAKVQTGEIQGEQREALRKDLEPRLRKLMSEGTRHPLFFTAALTAATFNDPEGRKVAHGALADSKLAPAMRLQALEALAAANDTGALGAVPVLLAEKAPADFRVGVLTAAGRFDSPKVAAILLEAYPKLEADLQPRAVETLTQRADWSKELLAAIKDKKIPTGAVNVNQARKMHSLKDAELSKLVTATWGTLREERNPEREKIVGDMKQHLARTRGDPFAGQAVFRNFCGQCHKMHGEGEDVGPDITVNGRSNFDQLVSNVFDPSLVIGAGYQAVSVTTKRGKVLVGLLVEDSPQRIVLKLQGGKLETIPREQIDEVSVANVSLMPEGVEKQLKPQEIADLFAYLCLDKPPSDKSARKIPGTPNPK